MGAAVLELLQFYQRLKSSRDAMLSISNVENELSSYSLRPSIADTCIILKVNGSGRMQRVRKFSSRPTFPHQGVNFNTVSIVFLQVKCPRDYSQWLQSMYS